MDDLPRVTTRKWDRRRLKPQNINIPLLLATWWPGNECWQCMLINCRPTIIIIMVARSGSVETVKRWYFARAKQNTFSAVRQHFRHFQTRHGISSDRKGWGYPKLKTLRWLLYTRFQGNVRIICRMLPPVHARTNARRHSQTDENIMPPAPSIEWAWTPKQAYVYTRWVKKSKLLYCDRYF